MNNEDNKLLSEPNQVVKFDTDKSRYWVNDIAHITIVMDNLTSESGSVLLELINNQMNIIESKYKTWSTNNNTVNINIDIPVGDDDFTGYLLKAKIMLPNKKPIIATSALDVSSDWSVFPRYASLTQWDKSPKVITKDIQNLNRLHINAALYYDAYYRPQNPIPNDQYYKDWLGNIVNVSTIKKAISEQHSRNQVALFYDMINATTGLPSDNDSNMNNRHFKNITKADGTRGLQSDMGIFRPIKKSTGNVAKTFDDRGEQITVNMLGQFNDKSDIDHKVQYYYDPSNIDWINYIGNIIKSVLDKYNFDGWQGDTAGNSLFITYNDAKNSNYSNIKETKNYLAFMANYLKKNFLQNYYIGINSVDGQGQGKLDKSESDFMYSEIWDKNGDKDDNTAPYSNNALHSTYGDLSRIADNTCYWSNKSLVMPSYMYKDYVPTNKRFLNNAIILKDISVFASGGDPMEFSDNAFELYSEYYSEVARNQKITMSPSLGDVNFGYIRKLYDFITAYENVLRDHKLRLNQNFCIAYINNNDYIGKDNASTNSVWTIRRSNPQNTLDTISLVNFMGIQNINWQVNNSLDENNKKNLKFISNITVKYYTNNNRHISNIYLASPDNPYNNEAQKLSFDQNQDNNGNYVQFTVPSLHYWDLIYMY